MSKYSLYNEFWNLSALKIYITLKCDYDLHAVLNKV